MFCYYISLILSFVIMLIVLMSLLRDLRPYLLPGGTGWIFSPAWIDSGSGGGREEGVLKGIFSTLYSVLNI